MISNDTFSEIFGNVSVSADLSIIIPRVVQAALRSGLAIVINRRDTKIPLCTLRARDAAAADVVSRETARKAGDPKWESRKHACGIAHQMRVDPDWDDDATAKYIASCTRTVQRLTKQFGHVNIGLDVGMSHYIVVDVDTKYENDAFLEYWTKETGIDQTVQNPTVRSPGSCTPDGRWIHKDGGHYWFTLPTGLALPDGAGSLKAPGGWSVLWHGRQVLVPPSERPEGRYQLQSPAQPAPEWLIDLIIKEVEAKKVRKEEHLSRLLDSTDPIEHFSSNTSWEEILLDNACTWTHTGLIDTCSCPVWTAPGDHASPKSATAHEPGCTRWNVDTGWGPLHVWTDNPPDFLINHKTVTKLQYVALRDHNGNHSSAMQTLGIARQLADIPEVEELDISAEPECELILPTISTQSTTEVEGSTFPLLPEEFWNKRKVLQRIRQFAHYRCASGDAVLLAALTRIAAMSHHSVCVDTGGDSATLNLISAVVGPPGAGKTVSARAARDVLETPAFLSREDAMYDDNPLGSGEGIAETYMGTVEEGTGQFYVKDCAGGRAGEEKTRTVRKQIRHNAMFYVDEGEAMLRVSKREGVTTLPVLRSAWVGATIGANNARSDTTRRIPEGSYSFGLLVGFQPDTVTPILEDRNGLLQRVLWSSAIDTAIPYEISPIEELIHTALEDEFGEVFTGSLALPGCIQTEIRKRRVAAARGDLALDPLEVHGYLARAKVSALLALLDNRHDISMEDWELSGDIWTVSCAVRDRLIELRAHDVREAQRARSMAEAVTKVAIHRAVMRDDETREEKAVTRIATRIAQKVLKEPLNKKVLNREVAGRDKKYLDKAVEHALDQGWIEYDGSLYCPGSHPLTE